MTWHTLFNLSTLEHRHLLFAYIAVWVIQGGYLSWVVWQWTRTRAPRL